MPAHFLSCDWGTSSLRLRLVSTATSETLAKSTADEGVRQLYELSQMRGVSRADLFAEVATKHIKEIAAKQSLDGEPLIISGMVSSTIGWKELPYARTPFALDASNLFVNEFKWSSPENLGPTYIVSGVATDTDMMRGEECQAVGIFARHDMEPLRDRALLILPGTHSKHIAVKAGSVVDFQTYMTGELFEALTKHSILQATVSAPPSLETFRSAFQEGLACVKETGLAAALFKVRTRGVLKTKDPRANSAFLSGLLIGAELENLKNAPDVPVIVAANEQLITPYAFALGERPRVTFTEVHRATVTAHKLILTNIFR